MSTDEMFTVKIDEETTLEQGDAVFHDEYGPMEVDNVSVSAFATRVRLRSVSREDGLSVEFTEEDLQEQWGETVAADPFALDAGKTSYKKEFASKDDGIEVTLEVSGPEDDAEPVMAHLDDQAVRVLQAMENKQPPEECKGRYEIDWEAIFAPEKNDE